MSKGSVSKSLNQLQFVLHKIVFGIIGWLIISWVIICQRKFVSENKIQWFLYGMGSLILFLWFFITTNKKSEWKVFDKYTDIASIFITIFTAMLLAWSLGIASIL